MLLEIKKLNKKFGSVVVAENINFSMSEKEVIGIIGSNGAGKTTFCNIITGYTKQDSGEIIFKGKIIGSVKCQLYLLVFSTVSFHRSVIALSV